ncbi:hypothetical protein [Frankia sp. Cj5]|uniref:hypothetical protein n=1 Tax=Frankia sp. Cj5 TaxID=2880978 RepID=UPI001EF6F6B6|nr:hypothetical protein [Frankia sp. Cj5]
MLVRDTPDQAGTYNPALVTTDTLTKPAQIIERYAARWSIEVAISDAKQIFGVGQAHNRAKATVECTVPFGLTCQTLTTISYTVAGHHTHAPWYTTKTHPSTADMHAKLRRVLITAKYQLTRPNHRPRQNSIPSAWSGTPTPHNCESQVVLRRRINVM